MSGLSTVSVPSSMTWKKTTVFESMAFSNIAANSLGLVVWVLPEPCRRKVLPSMKSWHMQWGSPPFSSMQYPLAWTHVANIHTRKKLAPEHARNNHVRPHSWRSSARDTALAHLACHTVVCPKDRCEGKRDAVPLEQLNIGNHGRTGDRQSLQQSPQIVLRMATTSTL